MFLYPMVALLAYLLGSLPFGYILLRVFRGQDVRQSGSGNIGATNVARSAPGLGLLTLVLDAGKGMVAVLIGMGLAPPSGSPVPLLQGLFAFAALAAFFAILGHVFPVWLKFRGGKGVATGVGAFLALAPKTVLLALVIFTAVALAFRYVSLGSIVATAALPALAYLLNGYHSSPGVLAAMCAGAVVIIAKHHENIRRLLAGTEPRFQLKHS